MLATSSKSLGALALLLVSAQAVQWGEYACMRSSGDMKKLGSSQYQSPGICQDLCQKEKGYFFALQGEDCWCGDEPPPFNDMGGTCDQPCPGWPDDDCGGDGTYSIWELEEEYPKNYRAEKTVDLTAAATTATTSSSSASSSTTSSTTSSSVDSTSAAVSSSSPTTTPSSVASTTSAAQAVETTSSSGASRRFRFLLF